MKFIIALSVIVILLLIYFYWETFLIVGTLGAVLYFIYIEFRKKQQQRKQDEQKKIESRQLLNSICDNSVELVRESKENLEQAEKYLDKAAVDFSEEAFSPFWDAIENTVTTLGSLNDKIQLLAQNHSVYKEIILEHNDDAPEYPLNIELIEVLKTGELSSLRMEAMVRGAQKNFQFSLIYEQRKTNQILVEGLTSFGQALREMSEKLTESIDGLTLAVDRTGESLDKLTSMVKDVNKVKKNSGAKFKVSIKNLPYPESSSPHIFVSGKAEGSENCDFEPVASKTKRCQCCGTYKDISEFYKNRTKNDKHNGICKLCQSKVDKKNRAAKG